MNEKRTEALLATGSDLAGSFRVRRVAAVWDFGFRIRISNFGFLYFNSPCLRAQNDYTVPQAHDPRPTSSAFPQRRPTAEAKGGILPDQHGEPSFSRGLGCWG